MGDILGGIFGGGQQGSQSTTVDPMTQQMNAVKLDQLRTMLGYGGTSGTQSGEFIQPSSAYTPSPMVDQLLGYGFGQGVGSPLMSFADYMQGGQQSADMLQAGIGNNAAMLSGGVDNSNTMLGGGVNNNLGMLSAGVNNNLDMLTGGVNNIQSQTDTAMQQGGNRFADAYKTAYNTGLDQTGNYISKIATPQIKQAMALQGLEGGGAVPESIAKATASIGLPYMQALIPMVQQYLQQQGGLQESNIAQQANLFGQSQGQQANLYGNAQQQQAGMYNTAQQGQTSLYGGAQQQQTGLYGTEMPLLNSFMQSLPGASIGLASAPGQIQQQRATTASTLFPMADYARSLQEQDLLRRQGLVQTAMTGIPYTPSTNVKQSTTQQPLFNWFGQG